MGNKERLGQWLLLWGMDRHMHVCAAKPDCLFVLLEQLLCLKTTSVLHGAILWRSCHYLIRYSQVKA